MEIAASTRALPGETENGDGYLVVLYGSDGFPQLFWSSSDGSGTLSAASTDVRTLGSGDVALLAVVDGVGHGSAAAQATKAILECVCRTPLEGLAALVRRCHHKALTTRGATVALALLDRSSSTLRYIGIGDTRALLGERQLDVGAVQTRSTRDEKVAFRELRNHRGLVGHNLPDALDVSTHNFSPGDRLFVCSDGVCRDVEGALTVEDLSSGAEAITEKVLSGWVSDQDDATVIVVA